jgi:hypothetical protein
MRVFAVRVQIERLQQRRSGRISVAQPEDAHRLATKDLGGTPAGIPGLCLTGPGRWSMLRLHAASTAKVA